MRRAIILAAIAAVCVACGPKQDYSDGSDSAKSQATSNAPKTGADGTTKGATAHKGLMVPQQAPPSGQQPQQPPHP